MGVDETNGAISRREALKTTAKAAGVAAFVAPVVVGVFSAQSVNAADCSIANDSDAVPATVTSGGTWNTNCGGQSGPSGRYNGQNANFTIVGGSGSVQVGSGGVDNFDTNVSFYLITNPAGYTCTANWTVSDCTGATALSTPALGAPSGAVPLPYCTTNCNGVKLTLSSVVCCPI